MRQRSKRAATLAVTAAMLAALVVVAISGSQHEPAPACGESAADDVLRSRFSRVEHQALGLTKPVFVSDNDGPPVLLLHELPGMTPESVCLAEDLVDRGFKVYLPLLFGKPARRGSLGNSLRVLFSGRWSPFAIEGGSPIVDWLADLSHRALVDTGAEGLGVIGMCLTGAVPLELLPRVPLRAAVLSQPSLPLPVGPGKAKRRASLGVSGEVIDAVRDAGLPFLALHFEGDTISPRERMAAFASTFEGQIEVHQLAGDDHSVLTGHYPGNAEVEETRERVLEYLDVQLKEPSADPVADR